MKKIILVSAIALVIATGLSTCFSYCTSNPMPINSSEQISRNIKINGDFLAIVFYYKNGNFILGHPRVFKAPDFRIREMVHRQEIGLVTLIGGIGWNNSPLGIILLTKDNVAYSFMIYCHEKDTYPLDFYMANLSLKWKDELQLAIKKDGWRIPMNNYRANFWIAPYTWGLVVDYIAWENPKESIPILKAFFDQMPVPQASTSEWIKMPTK
jgi:hypothetical protein